MIVLLLWLYLTGLIILAGAVVNSVIEHSSAEGKKPGEKVAGEVSDPREDVNEEMKEEKDQKR
ncbi:MAG: hypothetical protein ACD_55C00068G0001 [uncultured bacterium]|nr:MAG: hypothetical protein ACD_55C00068G0001 [uncultured bacterium]